MFLPALMLPLASVIIPFLSPIASAASTWPTWSFRSADLHPPALQITRSGPTAPGYLFFSPVDVGALIMSDEGDLIWEGPREVVSAFDKGKLDNEDILVYWTGAVFPDPEGFGYGFVRVFNAAYEQIYNLTLPQTEGPFYSGDGVAYDSYMDLHESFVTDRGSILVTATNVTQADLTAVGGPRNGWLRDSLFYEIDIKTNKVLYKWSSWEHRDQIPLTGTVTPLHGEGNASSSAFNYFHMNAVSLVENRYYLVSSRYYCSVFLIDSKDGSVVWQLQGQDGGDFKLPSDAQFCYQHDVRIASITSDNIVLHLHDNANAYQVNTNIPTSGLLLSLNLTSKEVTALRRDQNPDDPIYAPSQGSYQSLPNGHVFMDHGFVPKMEEFDESGKCVLTVQFAPGGFSYRGFRYRWSGQPTNTKPALAGCKKKGSDAVTLYVSWNGATRVKEWEVYGITSHNSKGKHLISVPKTGFETAITIGNTSVHEVQVRAKGFHQLSAPLSLSTLQSC